MSPPTNKTHSSCWTSWGDRWRRTGRYWEPPGHRWSHRWPPAGKIYHQSLKFSNKNIAPTLWFYRRAAPPPSSPSMSKLCQSEQRKHQRTNLQKNAYEIHGFSYGVNKVSLRVNPSKMGKQFQVSKLFITTCLQTWKIGKSSASRFAFSNFRKLKFQT